ncbi:MAG TPA: site-specific integrase [Parafilimonas sp.]|nr:site-specific integrase [Parafilimonas sp.]
MVGRTFSLLFYLKKPKNYTSGSMPVYLRITADGLLKEISLGRQWEPARWNAKSGKAIGSKEDTKKLNEFIDTVRSKVYNARLQLIEKNEAVTADELKKALTGEDRKVFLLLKVFDEHNEKMETLIEKKEYAEGTLTHFKTTQRHLKDFIKWKFQRDDFELNKIDYSFISDFEYYLKKEVCAHNTAMKYLGDFKKIILVAMKRSLISKDPFMGYSLRRKDVDTEFLVEHELNAIMKKTFLTDRLNLVKDIFLFSCFTGLAYADVKKLKSSEIRIGIDGKKWLFIKRQKSTTPAPVPLLPLAIEILDKYKNHPKCVADEKPLPILSNQKMNEYLKEIADLCGIQKELTYHTARHTFATTVTLNNNVPIESVSKMLGHKSLKQTQHYARILNKKVSEDMQALTSKLDGTIGKLVAV